MELLNRLDDALNSQMGIPLKNVHANNVVVFGLANQSPQRVYIINVKNL
jgi:hypothetical protein